LAILKDSRPPFSAPIVITSRQANSNGTAGSALPIARLDAEAAYCLCLQTLCLARSPLARHGETSIGLVKYDVRLRCHSYAAIVAFSLHRIGLRQRLGYGVTIWPPPTSHLPRGVSQNSPVTRPCSTRPFCSRSSSMSQVVLAVVSLSRILY